MADWLRRARRLKREKDPEPGFVVELFKSAAGRFSCLECGAVGLQAGTPREDEEDWGVSRPCEVCGRPVGAERLEIFPDTRVCASCKQKEERNGPSAEPEYCPRCGGLMHVQPSRRAGISRYVFVCSDCGKER